MVFIAIQIEKGQDFLCHRNVQMTWSRWCSVYAFVMYWLPSATVGFILTECQRTIRCIVILFRGQCLMNCNQIDIDILGRILVCQQPSSCILRILLSRKAILSSWIIFKCWTHCSGLRNLPHNVQSAEVRSKAGYTWLLVFYFRGQ